MDVLCQVGLEAIARWSSGWDPLAQLNKSQKLELEALKRFVNLVLLLNV